MLRHLSRAFALALSAASIAFAAPPSTHAESGWAPQAHGRTAQLPPSCERFGNGRQADQLIHDRYALPPRPLVQLPHELTWTENPFNDDNWEVHFHSLVWVNALTWAWVDTGDRSYRRKALTDVKSWVDKNPPGRPASPWAWNNLAIAQRAVVMTCLARAVSGSLPWLNDAIELHGATLAEAGSYKNHGNHALNQAIGLLEVGCWLGQHEWLDLADVRITKLVGESVDAQGVTNEQSIEYEKYNFLRYRLARGRLERCGFSVPAKFARIDRMPKFLAQATLPNGRYVTIGAGLDNVALPIPGTDAEYAATLGKRGPKPTQTIAEYRRGYVFGRTGWGEATAYQDEDVFSLRFGDHPVFHGHDDGGAVTLYGLGTPLVVDPGIKDYNRGPYKTFFKSRAAHNEVVLPNEHELSQPSSTLVRSGISPTSYDALVDVTAYDGVQDQRRVVFSRSLGYLVVDDQVTARRSAVVDQLWHLDADRSVHLHGLEARSSGSRGNVLIHQLVGSPAASIVKGQRDPLQGWMPVTWGSVAPAPVVVYSQAGRSVRFLTLLVPFEASSTPVVSSVTITEDGFAFTIKIGAAKERVVASATAVAISAVP